MWKSVCTIKYEVHQELGSPVALSAVPLTIKRVYQMKRSCWFGQDGAAGSSCQCPMSLLVPRVLLLIGANPAWQLLLTSWCPWNQGKDLCCSCPSLPCYATGKKTNTSLSEIMQIPSELPSFQDLPAVFQSHLATLMLQIWNVTAACIR